MLKRKLATLVVLLVMLFPSASVADTNYMQMRNPTKLCLPDLTKCLELPPGRFLAEPLWEELDIEMKRLQDQGTRLDAENQSLRDSADGVPWPLIAVATGIGLLAGFYIGFKL